MTRSHTVSFDAGNNLSLTLDEDQLGQIRNLITYTDNLPQFDLPIHDAAPSPTRDR